jgi:hypothetical protein
VATMWQTATNVVANAQSLYPSKSPSTTGLTTNVGTDFPYALSRKIPFRFARGIFFLKHGIGLRPNLCNWGTSYYARKRKIFPPSAPRISKVVCCFAVDQICKILLLLSVGGSRLKIENPLHSTRLANNVYDGIRGRTAGPRQGP